MRSRRPLGALPALALLCTSAGPAPKAPAPAPAAPTVAASTVAAPAPLSPRQAMTCIKEAYPEHICGVTDDALVWCDGAKTPYDDGATKATYDDVLNTADVQEHMRARYRLGVHFETPPVNHDPGRVRHEPLFTKMYGASRAEVRKRTRRIKWMPKTNGGKSSVRVTTVNGVDRRLEAISRELDALPAELKRFVATHSGTFVWRPIGGTKRLSMHSFALAIDVGVAQSDFWGWVKPDAAGRYAYANRIPPKPIVEIFERHGFIWGGKWYHFDTMHFEYRPELLHPACALPALPAAPATQPALLPPRDKKRGARRP